MLLPADALAEEATLDAAAIRVRWAEHLAGTHDRTGFLSAVLIVPNLGTQLAHALISTCPVVAVSKVPL